MKKLPDSTPSSSNPMGGMRMSLIDDLTTLPKAPPTMKPTAISINSLAERTF